jgi:SAM-dependent methyltransferase
MRDTDMQEWWRDYRCHFGKLDESSPMITDRSDARTALQSILQYVDLEEGSQILDLCCGPGRYATELAKMGFEVVGIDINEDYVALAQKIAEQERVSPEIIVGDMRELAYVDRFDAVINVGTSFGFFETDAENQLVVESLARALKPGGRFLLEMGNRDYLLKNFEAANSRENPDGSVTQVQRIFDYERSRINTTFRRSSNGELVEAWAHSWRAYTLAEVASLLSHADLELVDTFGGWQSEPYNVDAPRMVAISKKRANR